jgi:polyisoprenoid-binding protein YceI
MPVVENTREELPSSGSWSVDPAHSTIEFRVRYVVNRTVSRRFGNSVGVTVVAVRAR